MLVYSRQHFPCRHFLKDEIILLKVPQYCYSFLFLIRLKHRQLPWKSVSLLSYCINMFPGTWIHKLKEWDQGPKARHKENSVIVYWAEEVGGNSKLYFYYRMFFLYMYRSLQVWDAEHLNREKWWIFIVIRECDSTRVMFIVEYDYRLFPRDMIFS